MQNMLRLRQSGTATPALYRQEFSLRRLEIVLQSSEWKELSSRRRIPRDLLCCHLYGLCAYPDPTPDTSPDGTEDEGHIRVCS